MKRAALLAIVVAGILCACQSGRAEGARAWTCQYSVRIPPTEKPGTARTAVIYAARGETQSFQVAVHASGGKLTGLNFSVSNLYGIQQDDHGGWDFTGRLISQKKPILYRKKYMTVLAHSSTWNGPPSLPITNIDIFPDALIPFIDPARKTVRRRHLYCGALECCGCSQCGFLG